MARSCFSGCLGWIIVLVVLGCECGYLLIFLQWVAKLL